MKELKMRNIFLAATVAMMLTAVSSHYGWTATADTVVEEPAPGTDPSSPENPVVNEETPDTDPSLPENPVVTPESPFPEPPSPPDTAIDEAVPNIAPSLPDNLGGQTANGESVTQLIGVSVVEGGLSYAVFQLGNQSVLVREGNEIVPGLRLVKVRRKGADAERAGEIEQFRLGKGGNYRMTKLGRTDESAQSLRERARRRVRFLTNLPER